MENVEIMILLKPVMVLHITDVTTQLNSVQLNAMRQMNQVIRVVLMIANMNIKAVIVQLQHQVILFLNIFNFFRIIIQSLINQLKKPEITF